MAKRQTTGSGRRGPEPDYQREMRRAFERPNNENKPAGTRSFIPQPTSAQSGTSSQGGQRDSTSVKKFVGSHIPQPKDAKDEEKPLKLTPDEQFQLDMMTAIERSLEECYTPLVNPFPDVQVIEKDDGMPFGQMTVKADIHRGGNPVMKFRSGGQMPPQGSRYPYHRAPATQFPNEPVYAVPVKINTHNAPQMDRPKSPTPSSDSSIDRPPTPHPRSWIPAEMKYLEEDSPQNIHQRKEHEETNQQDLNCSLTDEEQYQLDTQLAIQHSLQEAFAYYSAKAVGVNENVMMTNTEKQVDNCGSEVSQTCSSQLTHLNVTASAGMEAQHAGSDDLVMVSSMDESVTKTIPVPGMVCTSPPKPARLYVRGVNAPPGMEAQHDGRDDIVMVASMDEAVTKTVPVPGMVCTSPPKPARLYVRGINAPPSMMEPITSVVPRVANVQCPPPSPNDLDFEDIIPSTTDGPQQDNTDEEQPNDCCDRFMDTCIHGMDVLIDNVCLWADYTWRCLCHCRPIPGTCAHN